MQTLHLRFRDLRAILLGETPSRWPTPSGAMRAGTKGHPGLSNSPGPTLAVGAPPGTSRQRLDRCPTPGAGLPLASPFREAHGVGPRGAAMCRVCRWQTASDLIRYPAHHEAGDIGSGHLQARASEVRCTPSFGPSFPIRPQLRGERSGWERTAGPVAGVGTPAVASSCARRYRSRLRRG